MTRGSCTVAMNPGCAWVAPGTTFRRDVQVRARKGREYRGSCATHNQKVADSNPAPATMTPPFPPRGGGEERSRKPLTPFVSRASPRKRFSGSKKHTFLVQREDISAL